MKRNRSGLDTRGCRLTYTICVIRFDDAGKATTQQELYFKDLKTNLKTNLFGTIRWFQVNISDIFEKLEVLDFVFTSSLLVIASFTSEIEYIFKWFKSTSMEAYTCLGLSLPSVLHVYP